MPPSSRIPAMDVLRGCAVMGILWMNITAFAQPQSAYINPAAAGPLTAALILMISTFTSVTRVTNGPLFQL